MTSMGTPKVIPAKNREGGGPWGGEKLGFSFAEVGPENQKATAAIKKAQAIVEAAQKEKRDRKVFIEHLKEARIKALSILVKDDYVAGLRNDTKKRLPPGDPGVKQRLKVAKRLVQGNHVRLPGLTILTPDHIEELIGLLVIAPGGNEGLIEIKKKILHDWDDQVGNFAGWNWSVMSKRFEVAGFEIVDKGGRRELMAMGDEGPLSVCTVTFGSERYAEKKEEPGVLVQRGYEKLAIELRRRKEYVLDANLVPTRRFLTRAIGYHHMATMLGLKFDKNSQLFVVNEDPEKIMGQVPRGTGETFAGNAWYFDLKNAAVIDYEQWKALVGTDPIESDGVTITYAKPTGDGIYDVKILASGPEGLKHTTITGFKLNTSAARDSAMDLNERVSMQLRNGSGPDQTMLSAASIQRPAPGREDDPAKVIRGNKGERFDESPETVAVIEIDLALAQKQGVKFVNVHSSDSHKYKIAYDRYVQLDIGKHMKEQGITHFRTDDVKRTALEELDEYIYSARKNREITLTSIPNSIIHKINFKPSIAWFGPDFPFQAPEAWIDWDQAESALKKFFNTAKLNEAKKVADEKKAAMEGSID